MEDERLADVAPAAGGRFVVEEEQQQQQEHDAAWRVHGVNDEHHHQAAHDAQQAGVPREQLEGGSVEHRAKTLRSPDTSKTEAERDNKHDFTVQ